MAIIGTESVSVSVTVDGFGQGRDGDANSWGVSF